MENFTAERQSDKVLYVTFYTDAIEVKSESEVRGHPVFKDVDMVRIIAPGDKNNIIETRVDDTHKMRFPEKWKQFKSGQVQGINGWLLKEWPAITASQMKELNYHEIHTVEQLAALSDGAIAKVGMGTQELRTKAKAALAAAHGNANNEAQAAEIERLRADLEAMRKMMAQPSTNEDEPKKRGRPAKVNETIEE